MGGLSSVFEVGVFKHRKKTLGVLLCQKNSQIALKRSQNTLNTTLKIQST
ncbi:hypothetical protein BTM305_15460 [Helicobacter pylori]